MMTQTLEPMQRSISSSGSTAETLAGGAAADAAGGAMLQEWEAVVRIQAVALVGAALRLEAGARAAAC